MSFRQIDYVIAVAETGSTAAAARLLNVSQPSVSLAVGKIEAALGQPLFFRSPGQGLEPTAFGARKLADMRSLRQHAETTLGQGTPVLDLGTFATLGPRYVPSLVRAFREHHPEAEIRIHEADLETLFRWMTSGRIETALIYSFGLPQDVEITPLREIRPYALVSADHRLAARHAVDLADLLADPLVLINLPHSRGYFLSLAQMHGISPTIAFETESIEMLRSMVANGFGVGLLATDIPHDSAYDGNPLRMLRLAGDLAPHTIALAHRTDRHKSDLHIAFALFAREYFRNGRDGVHGGRT